MTAHSGYLGQSGQRLHFGLGEATTVDSLVVDWPGGMQQVLENVAVNQLIYVNINDIYQFGAGEMGDLPPFAVAAEMPEGDHKPIRVFPNPTLGRVSIEVRPPTLGSFSVDVFDIRGRRVDLLLGNRDGPETTTLEWDAANAGQAVPAGKYLIQLRSGDQAWLASVVVLR